MCTAAYREALTRDLSFTASSAPASTPAPGQRHATEAGREDVAGRPVRPPADPRQNDLLGTLLAVAGLTTVPAKIGARTPAPQILQSETA
jgi:hypothetical protein